MTKTTAIIQARMGSTRLPNKVLLDIAGQPMLRRCITRLKQAKTIDSFVIATTDQPPDDAIEALCRKEGWDCFRGSEHDVLDRYYQAASKFQADIVVRVTSDCPLLDPEMVDYIVNTYLENQPLDYVTNRLPPLTYPRGQEIDVISYEALSIAWTQDTNLSWREHVTPFIYNHPDKFNIRKVQDEQDHSDSIWTVDTPDDLAFVRKIYEYFDHDHFTSQDIFNLLEKYPEWTNLNHNIIHNRAWVGTHTT